MKKLQVGGAAAVIGLLIGLACWWVTTDQMDNEDRLNNADAFVYPNNGMIYYFELNSYRGRVDGILHELKLREESGRAPYIEEMKYPLSGKTTDKGYEFRVIKQGNANRFQAWFSGPHLVVQQQGEGDDIRYNPVSHAQLATYVEALKQYHTEYREQVRRRDFFSQLSSVYGYWSSTKIGSSQLFIRIDEALLEGELSGTLLMMTDTGDPNRPYEESKYPLNGITDGSMMEFFTIIDGEKIKLKGYVDEAARGLDLSYGKSGPILSFHAVTEEEFNKHYHALKINTQHREE